LKTSIDHSKLAGGFERTHEVLEQAIREKWTPGAIAAVWNVQGNHHGLPWVSVVGDRRTDPSREPLEWNTVFDLASLTKPLVTATLAARLVERGLLDWTTPVRSILEAPEEWSGIELWHLLSHTAGFQAWSPFWQVLRERFGAKLSHASIRQRSEFMRAEVLRQLPETEPGRRTLYSDVSFLALGFIVEQVTGMRLDHAWDELGFGARFRPVHRHPSMQQPADDRCAATESSEWRGGVMQGEVHDENCWSMGGVAGHAGLFGTAEQVIEIVNAVFTGRLFSDAIADVVFARVTPSTGDPRTMGWDIPSGESSSAGPILAARRGVVGHLGFTGTSLWVDRQSGWAFLLLTNRVHFGRDNVGIRQLRPLFHQAAIADLGIDRFSSLQ
jgi:CubicO group peptidase (beta-lactamase class C family)